MMIGSISELNGVNSNAACVHNQMNQMNYPICDL